MSPLLFWLGYVIAGLFVSRWAYRTILRRQIKRYQLYRSGFRSLYGGHDPDSLDDWLGRAGTKDARWLLTLAALLAWPVALPVVVCFGQLQGAFVFVRNLLVAFYTKPTLKDRAERMRAEG